MCDPQDNWADIIMSYWYTLISDLVVEFHSKLDLRNAYILPWILYALRWVYLYLYECMYIQMSL